MRVFIEGNRIKIRREGIFLCLDRGNWSNLWMRLYEFIRTQCRNFDIPLKIGVLSWDKELDTLPDGNFLKSLERRGSFITPLVENIFPQLKEKEYDLIIIPSAKIYDWQDWQEEIAQRFNKVYEYNLNDLEKMTLEDLEKLLLQDIFNFKISDVALDFKDSLCWDFPEEFRLIINQGRFILTGSFDKRYIDIELKACGPDKETKFTLNACSSNVQMHIKNVQPGVSPSASELESNDAKVFLKTIEIYKAQKSEHYCPLCQEKHKFPKAFICDRRKSEGEIFTKGCVIFDEVQLAKRTNSRYVIFWHKGDKLYWQILGKPVICVKNKEFVIMPDDGRISYVRISDRLDVSELEEIHKGLFYYPGENIYIMTLG